MENLIDLCARIEEASCQIILHYEGRRVSAGSGVFVDGGLLLTAGHVVAGKSGKQKVDSILVRGRTGKGSWEGSTPFSAVGPLWVHPDRKMFRPVPIDLAAIRLLEIPPDIVPLPLAPAVAARGTEVVMAGYPDDVGMPLDFMSQAETLNPDMATAKREVDQAVGGILRMMMMKRSMVGAAGGIQQSGHEVGTGLEGAEYWLDNDLTYGGSGGPVVDMQGRLVGIVTRKAHTDASELKIRSVEGDGTKMVERIFSGTGIALDPRIIIQAINEGVVELPHPTAKTP